MTVFDTGPTTHRLALGALAPSIAVQAFGATSIAPTAMLIGVVILVACTIAMMRLVPDPPARWRRVGPPPDVIIADRRRNPVTGLPPELARAPITIEHVPTRRPPRQIVVDPDPLGYDIATPDERSQAEQVIERLVANDPELLAAIITNWLRDDEGDLTT